MEETLRGGRSVRNRFFERARRVWKLVRASAERFSDCDAPRLAASMSFYTLFSLLPMLLLLGALAEHALGDSSLLRDRVLEWAAGTAPDGMHQALGEALADVARRAPSPTAGIGLGVIGALLGASGVFVELDSALSRIFQYEPKRRSFLESLLALVRERLSGFLVVTGTAVALLVTTLARGALELPSWFPGAALLGGFVSLVVGGGVVTGGIALCYRLLPGVPVGWRHAAKGAITASLLLHLVREPFTWFVVHLTRYAAYGVIGGVLGVLTWFQVAACLLLFGACVAAESKNASSEIIAARGDAGRAGRP